MVFSRMAAVLAVALLLLCGNVYSVEVALTGFVTQVKTAQVNSSSTAPAATPYRAPAITTPVGDSSATHSAVLSAVPQQEKNDVMLVDLARADDEKMLSMTLPPSPLPSGGAPSKGFDMIEAEAPGPDFPDLSAPGPDSAPSPEQGSLVSDVDDDSFPNLGGDEDNTYRPGYGVQTVPPSPPTGESFSAYGKDPSGSDGKPGTLVSDVNDSSFPNLGGDEDNTYRPGYGVQTVPPSPPTGESFSAYGEGSFDSDGEQGTVFSDVDDTSFSDNTTGESFSVANWPSEEDSVVTEGGAGSESKVTFRQSRTYTPPPKSGASWGTGKCTFYGGMDASGTMSGACGYGNLYASGYGAYSTALSSALFKNGMACGACYEVACSGNRKSCKPGSVLVTVTNFCPPNPGQSANNGGWCNGNNQHFDLSYPAFAKIADPKAGVVDLKYRRVPCKKIGGIRFTLNGNCNFNLVTITNVGGSGVVTEAYMKGDGMDWALMSRNWGANWQCTRNYCGKGISIKIVTSDKKVSVSRLANKDWAFGKTYIGQQVY